jgi:copper chaperone
MKMSIEKKVFQVEGMSCGHCVSRVKKAVGELKSVCSVEVDLKGKSVEVQFDASHITPADIIFAIEEQGYTVL